MVSVHLENSTCTAPHLSKIFPMLPLKQWKQFQYLVDDGCLMSFHGRLCSALSFHASLLQKLMLCSVTSSLWDMAYRDGFLSFFPAVDMCRERKLGNLCCVTSLFWGITRRDGFLSFFLHAVDVFCYFIILGCSSWRWFPVFLSLLPACSPSTRLTRTGCARWTSYRAATPCSAPAAAGCSSCGLSTASRSWPRSRPTLPPSMPSPPTPHRSSQPPSKLLGGSG